jgi:hypothetical protein
MGLFSFLTNAPRSIVLCRHLLKLDIFFLFQTETSNSTINAAKNDLNDETFFRT